MKDIHREIEEVREESQENVKRMKLVHERDMKNM